MNGLERGKVKLLAYDTKWLDRYREEKELLTTIFSLPYKIYHVGSTAVPGLAAKPIIDIHLLLPFKDYPVSSLIDALTPHDYHFREHASSDSKVFFAKGPEENRTVYLHIFDLEEPALDHIRALAFRNYLRTHEAVREQYEELKTTLAQQMADDREGYTAAKEEFIVTVSIQAVDQNYHNSRR